MLLNKMIKECPKLLENISVKGLSLDSRDIKKGYLFFAIKGHSRNGENFVKEALSKGACAAVVSKKFRNISNLPIIRVNDTKTILSRCCKIFFKKKPKNIVAVTGTNGKSSVADFFRQIFVLNKKKAASIGTLGIIKNNKKIRSTLTSLDIITLHKELEKMAEEKINNVIIEASSHGLDQGRLNGIDFKACVFTNFSQDHLDYHKNMMKYFNAKLILIKKLMQKNSFLITDSSIKKYKTLKKISLKKKIKIIDIKNSHLINQFTANNLIGSFQMNNLIMSSIAAEKCGLKNYDIISKINNIKNVEGRVELIKTLPNKTKIFIDYAHTPDALLNVLKSLKEHFKTKITLVFGCGGDRDISKRKVMANIASKYCNKIYVTDDNPRNESPRKIRNDIIRHVSIKDCQEIADREKAIKNSIRNSNFYDIILIAGKGHETLQDYGKKKFYFSDKIVIKKIKFKKLSKKIQKINFNSNIINKIAKKHNKYNYSGVSINSKTLKNNNLFIAIKGDYKDGHEYLKESLKRGARFCVVSKSKVKKNKKFIFVKNTNSFFRNYADMRTNLLNSIIIGVTGSVGKTSLKNILGQILNKTESTYFSPHSYNNKFGVQYSLSNLEPYHRYGVFEIGMSKKGEINKLSKLAKPHISIITNISEAHIENFKNIKGIAKAKSEIIDNTRANGVIILNKDDKFFNFLKKKAITKKLKVVSFGLSKKADIFPIKITEKKDFNIIKLKIFNQKMEINTKNINIYNLLCTFAVLKELDINLLDYKDYFLNYEKTDGRGKNNLVKRFNIKFNLIDDSYNANPLSMKNSIQNLSKINIKNVKKYLLLGDMLELGKKSYYYHKNLANVINGSKIDKLFIFGKEIMETYKSVDKSKRGNILQQLDDFDIIFKEILNSGDYLLLKGSNATGLNKLSKKIITNSGLKNVI